MRSLNTLSFEDRGSPAQRERRRRILEATMELHGANGILATSWEEIAESAGVSVGTVYRHFPTLDDLVLACGEFSLGRLAPPSDERIAEVFEGARSRRERILRAAREIRARYGERAIRNYIISHTETVSDLLEVPLLQKETGLLRPAAGQLDVMVIPLFETIPDLQRAPDIMREWMALPFVNQLIWI